MTDMKKIAYECPSCLTGNCDHYHEQELAALKEENEKLKELVRGAIDFCDGRNEWVNKAKVLVGDA